MTLDAGQIIFNVSYGCANPSDNGSDSILDA